MINLAEILKDTFRSNFYLKLWVLYTYLKDISKSIKAMTMNLGQYIVDGI